MQIFVTVVAVLILAIGITISQRRGQISFNPQPTKEESLSEISDSTKNENDDTEDDSKEDGGIPATSTITPRVESFTEEDYKYPGSVVVDSTSNSLILESTDGVDQITDWYKEKIDSSGMNIKTYVVTKANDDVLNKLVGSNGEGEVVVEIKQNSGEALVIIVVVF